jgi:DNA-binding MarR family transcriptional regulator
MSSTESILPPDRPADASTRVLRQFRIVFNAVRGHFRQVERDAGIGGAQLWALSEIAAAGGIGVNDLALALDIHQSTASNLVRTLTERGLIRAQRRAEDRRATALFVTAEGQAILASAPAPFRGVLPAALGNLAPEVLARMEGDLAQLISALRADEDSAKTPLADL